MVYLLYQLRPKRSPMKKIFLVIILSGTLFSCKKENAAPSTDASLKGSWKSNLTTDVVFDNATDIELTRVSYLHGLETDLTFDGAGSVTSFDTQYNTSLVHTYSLHSENGRNYISTQIVGINPTDYEIVALSGPDLQLKGTIITNSGYSINGKNYRVHYIRTQYFVKQ